MKSMGPPTGLAEKGTVPPPPPGARQMQALLVSVPLVLPPLELKAEGLESP